MNIGAHLEGERLNVLGQNLNLNPSPHVLAGSKIKNRIMIKNKSVISK